jgi:excisionase family DNA binding protein
VTRSALDGRRSIPIIQASGGRVVGNRVITIEELAVQKLLYTVEETAELFSVGRCKVYELVSSGELYSVKLGRSRRIPAIAIERYIAALTDCGEPA